MLVHHSSTDESARVYRPAGRLSRIAWNACARRRWSTEHDARRRDPATAAAVEKCRTHRFRSATTNAFFLKRKTGPGGGGQLKTVVFALLSILPFFRISLNSYKWERGGMGWVSGYMGAVLQWPRGN